ncbi:hypothetical protein FQN57_004245 [Myotisia sp. PD_48]|nr:hypothetical protein FQN57_004245 [Myotisia sp. PD_48]
MKSLYGLKPVALVALVHFTLPVLCHTWIEQLMVVAMNGTFVGEPGYPRANVRRDTPGFADPSMVYQLGPTINDTALICKDTQRNPKQTDKSPMLKASPGAVIALRYQENGHVTLPKGVPGKPDNRGSVYVYGTTQPKPDDKLLAVKKWNERGDGGDKRGLLLSVSDYDDGRCYQVNGDAISKERQAKFPHEADKLMGADIWCQQDFALPKNVPTGKYTIYWVWDWPTLKDNNPKLPHVKEETYTTCIDIDVVAEGSVPGVSKAAKMGYIKDQSLNNAAIPSQLERLNLSLMIPGGSSNSPSSPPSPSSPTSSAPPAASSPPPAASAPPAAGSSKGDNIIPIPSGAVPKAKRADPCTKPGHGRRRMRRGYRGVPVEDSAVISDARL